MLATILGSSDSRLYELLFYLHIMSAIVGFGAVFLNGIYGMQAEKRGGREGLAINEATMAVSNVAELFIYAVFGTGLLMGILADDVGGVSLGDLWLSLAMALFIIAIGLSHGILRPSFKKMNAAMAATLDADPDDPPAEAAEIEALGRRVGATGAVLNIIVVVILYLMIWKPGLN